jgi:hypothetical protein
VLSPIQRTQFEQSEVKRVKFSAPDLFFSHTSTPPTAHHLRQRTRSFFTSFGTSVHSSSSCAFREDIFSNPAWFYWWNP